MSEWAYCPNCLVRTDNERREDGKYYCTCGMCNPNIRVGQEADNGKQAKVTAKAVRGKDEIYQ